ncbi:MAG: VOC family protein [Asgard group archaeon]|nr:VOC family protein [Asgard group archaeon]
MKRVTGIGGIFFKSEDPEKLKEWYAKHLGVPIVEEEPDESYVIFDWQKQADEERKGYTLWGPFKEDTEYMRPSKKEFMFNFTVENLAEILAILRDEGVNVFDEIEDNREGKFGWIMDPEGNKIELWEPKKKRKEN